MFMWTSSSDWSQTNLPSRDFGFDLAQSARDHHELVSRENSSSGKSGGMRDGSGNIVAIKPSIERNRFAITLSNLGCGR
jgi:hypothetical protein